MTARHLYIHVPFCARRCTYCDFSIAVRKRTPVAEYLTALSTELALAGGAPEDLRTVYLGGGTPSRLGGQGIAGLAKLLGPLHGLEEFTLEANPDDVTPETARAWAGAGVTRLSIGAQSFDPGVLEWMHRTHGPEAIGASVRAARAAGIGSVSLDVIFALPDSLGRDLRADLARAVELEPDHISLYGLTVEQRTPLQRRIARGEEQATGEERYEEEYLLAHDALNTAGYAFYEVSNAARSGHEAVHNRAYWLLVPYLGLGPSAHSFDGTRRWWNEPAYARWKVLLRDGSSPVIGSEQLTADEQATERWYLGLRTSEGVDIPQPCAGDLSARVESWKLAGWATVERGQRASRLRLTPRGWLRLDDLVASI